MKYINKGSRIRVIKLERQPHGERGLFAFVITNIFDNFVKIESETQECKYIIYGVQCCPMKKSKNNELIEFFSL